ncbi:unnamed protein product [Rotaria sp. Silwood1]|nr:unnamed protein product [Rotaria sp. Silwood1]
MAFHCTLDQLPVELLHTLFTYFSSSELLYTFYHVSDYVIASLQSYSSYQLDFKSISKSNFRCICRHVQPEQVISLTLSDSNDTPGQSELFFNRFRMEQFTRLRSLTLVEIEFNSLESIFLNLSKLHELRSFSFDAYSIRHIYGVMDLNSIKKLEQINNMLRNTYAQVFPQLNYLCLNGDWVLDTIPLPNILHLKLEHCPLDKLATIADLAPKLRSLDACVDVPQMNSYDIILSSQLTRVRLIMKDFTVSMNYMEYILSNRLYLKHLELHLKGFEDLADGQRWQRLTSSLQTFNFKFNIQLDSIEQILNTFRTLFWLKEKQWFVAYQDKCLFSLPFFAPKHIDTSCQMPIYSTAPNDTVFYENVTQLSLSTSKKIIKYFTHINTLKLEDKISQQELLRFVNLRYVKHLVILSLDDLLQFTPIECKIPQLRQLTIENKITRKEIEKMMCNSYEQIRTLEISIILQDQNHIVDELLRLFSHTEHFIYNSDIQSIQTMVLFIDGFKHLSSASFISQGPLYNQPQHFRYTHDLIILKTNRIKYGISTCRIYYLPDSTSLFCINWWIEE